MRRPEASPLASFLRSTLPPPFPTWVPGGLLGRGREGLSKAEVMRADVAAGGASTLPGFLGEEEPIRSRGRRAPPRAGGRRWRPCSRQRRQLLEICLCDFACSVFSASRPSTMSCTATDATGVMLLHNHINGRSGHGLLKFSGLPKILRVDLILLHDVGNSMKVRVLKNWLIIKVPDPAK